MHRHEASLRTSFAPVTDAAEMMAVPDGYDRQAVLADARNHKFHRLVADHLAKAHPAITVTIGP